MPPQQQLSLLLLLPRFSFLFLKEVQRWPQPPAPAGPGGGLFFFCGPWSCWAEPAAGRAGADLFFHTPKSRSVSQSRPAFLRLPLLGFSFLEGGSGGPSPQPQPSPLLLTDLGLGVLGENQQQQADLFLPPEFKVGKSKLWRSVPPRLPLLRFFSSEGGGPSPGPSPAPGPPFFRLSLLSVLPRQGHPATTRPRWRRRRKAGRDRRRRQLARISPSSSAGGGKDRPRPAAGSAQQDQGKVPKTKVRRRPSGAQLGAGATSTSSFLRGRGGLRSGGSQAPGPERLPRHH